MNSMNRDAVIKAIETHTSHSKKVIKDVLQAMGVVLTGELQANEPVDLPYMGRLLPVDVPQGQNRRVRLAQFEASPGLRKKLSSPVRRARVAAR